LSTSQYHGGIFDKSLPMGKATGELILENLELKFKGNETTCSIPLYDLELTKGGADNRLIFFSHPSRPGVSIHTGDREILRSPLLLDCPHTASQIRTINRRNLQGKLISTGVFLALGLLCLGLLSSRGLLARAIAKKIPAEMEEELGKSTFAQISVDRKLITDEGIQSELTDLVAPLVQVLPNDRYSFHFHIIEDSSLNAFAIPGGFVVLHTGLLLKAQRPEEILGVLAHEIAHVTQQHGIRNIIESAGLFLVVQSVLGDLTGIAAVLADGGSFILHQKFSRNFEEEADDIGLGYLFDAGIDPSGFIDFFHRIKDEQDKTILGKATSNLTWLSTHPATEDRIESLSQKIQSLSFQRNKPIDFNFKQFKDNLRYQLNK
jgi:Zn-dependent protease with chaperone function